MAYSSSDFRGTMGLIGGFLDVYSIKVTSYTRFLERTMRIASDHILAEDDPIARRTAWVCSPYNAAGR